MILIILLILKMNAEKNNQHLVMIDSDEMLKYLPESKVVTKMPFKFPDEFELSKYENKVDSINEG